MKFFSHVDFNKVSLLQASIQTQASAPTTPVTGQIYYDSALGMLQIYSGSTWGLKASDSTKLNGQAASYYLDRANHSGTQSFTSINLSSGKLLGRTSALTGAAEEISVTSGLSFASGALAMANMPANTLKGNNTVGSAAPADLSVAQVRTLLTINNVDNTSDASKPVSTATQTALNLKQDLDATLTALAGLNWSAGSQVVVFTAGDTVSLCTIGQAAGNLLDKTAGDALYTPFAHAGSGGTAHAVVVANGSAGFMSGADKNKLDGVATGATANSSDATLLARSNHTGTQTASTITDLATTVKGYRLDEFAAPTVAINANNQKITSLATPVSPADAATMQFVLDQIQASSSGISVKNPVRVVSLTNINIATGGLVTIDGVTVAAGNRVLLVGQTDPKQNGVYAVAAGAWTRHTEEDASSELKGAFWLVNEGTAGAGTQWIVNNATQPVIGTDSITIVQFGAVVSYTASNGVTKVGNDFRAQVVASGGITTGASGLAVDTAIVARKFSATIGDNSVTNIVVTHGLGTKDVAVSVRDTGNDEVVYINWVATSTNTITVSAVTAPATNSLRVTVVG